MSASIVSQKSVDVKDGDDVEVALNLIPRISETEIKEAASYLHRECYRDVGCLREARLHDKEWQSLELPLRIKHGLLRVIASSCSSLPSASSASSSTRGTARGLPPEDLPGVTTGLHALLTSTIIEIGTFLGPAYLARLSSTTRYWKAMILSEELASLWEQFLGDEGQVLISRYSEPMRKYGQLASVNLHGTWLDHGTDDEERYKFLTAMRQVKKHGPLDRSMEAISYLTDVEMKISYARLTGAVYIAYERFKLVGSGRLAPIISIASGVLDLRKPNSPRIFGTWLQYHETNRTARTSQRLGFRSGPSWSLSRPKVIGKFEFSKIDPVYDEKASKRRRLREKAGLDAEGPLYVSEPVRPLDEND
eukprot:TRINITY_DN37561_c0_g1_i1.p1 TRINITY_DN37561_c0_g1~~TRINITY_DN37561_c0_g1_i1.p1  ORF type:complete len:373 (+),score=51.78 TRINITY_DN37561_c0_g1_i1:28-1119(+)